MLLHLNYLHQLQLRYSYIRKIAKRINQTNHNNLHYIIAPNIDIYTMLYAAMKIDFISDNIKHYRHIIQLEI